METKNLFLIASLGLAISCGGQKRSTTHEIIPPPPPHSYDQKISATADGTNNNDKQMEEDITSSAAKTENNGDRKFIRTARIKFRTENVSNSTYTIEDIVHNEKGFVTYTELTSTISGITHTPISKDSTLETTHYVVQNQMTFRVPDERLDTTLKQIADEIDFLDSRVITASDVTLQMYANKKTMEKKYKDN